MKKIVKFYHNNPINSFSFRGFTKMWPSGNSFASCNHKNTVSLVPKLTATSSGFSRIPAKRRTIYKFESQKFKKKIHINFWYFKSLQRKRRKKRSKKEKSEHKIWRQDVIRNFMAIFLKFDQIFRKTSEKFNVSPKILSSFLINFCGLLQLFSNFYRISSKFFITFVLRFSKYKGYSRTCAHFLQKDL